MATVVSVGSRAQGFSVGDRILLAQGAGYGRRVKFGERDELTLEAITFLEVMMTIADEVERGEEHHLANIAPRDQVIDPEEATTFDEGDSRAIQ